MSSAVSSNTPSMSGLGLLMGGDPLSMAVDIGGSILGLSPEAKNVAKVALGFASANPFMIFSGLQGLAQNATEAATTEYRPPEYTSVSGYADPAVKKPVRQASEPSGGTDCTQTSSDRPETSATPPGGIPNAPAGGKAAKLSQEDLDYYQACSVLASNFTRAETAGFWAIKDGKLSMMDLERIANDPNAPPELVKAALFFTENPDRFYKLAAERHEPWMNGPFISLAGMRMEVQEGVRRGALVGSAGASSAGEASAGGVGGSPATSSGTGGSSGASGTTGSSGASSSSATDALDAILNNPNLSPSEKAEQILMKILMDLDGDMLGLLGDMREVRKKQANAGDDKEKSAELASDMELLQHRLQKVMERRTQMMTLLTNMSKLTHDANMAAINNTR